MIDALGQRLERSGDGSVEFLGTEYHILEIVETPNVGELCRIELFQAEIPILLGLSKTHVSKGVEILSGRQADQSPIQKALARFITKKI